jgi:hypothetical protein
LSSVILDRFYDAYSKRLDEQRRKQEEQKSRPGKSTFVRIVQKRLSKDKDARIVIAGEGGAGKSTIELRLAELLNPSLYVDHQQQAIDEGVSFTAKQYMTGVRTLPSLYEPPADPLERTQLSFDEPGQAWYHRQFMSEANMILAKTMLGFRFKKFITVLTVPNLDLLDLDALRLVNWLIWVPDQGRAEVFRVMVQKFGGDPWYKKIIDKMTFSKPDAKLWHMYEKKKFAAQDELYERFGKKLDELEAPRLTNTEIIEIIKEEPKKYMKGGFLYVPYLQRDFKVGLNRGYLIKAVFETNDENPDRPDESMSDESAADLLKKVLD